MNARLKVGHLNHSLELGGAELALIRMLKTEPYWDASVFLPKGNSSVTEWETIGGFTKVTQHWPSQESGAAGAQSMVSKAVFGLKILSAANSLKLNRRFRSCQVIHANSTRSAVYGALAVNKKKQKFVVHLRDMVSIEALGAAGFSLYTKLVLPRADVVISNSEATLLTARPFISDKAKSFVIPSASGLERPAAKPDFSPVPKTIAMVARIDPWKGQELLIRAVAGSSLLNETRLVFAGAPAFGHEKYLESLIELAEDLGMADRIEFRGHVADVNGFIDEADICVQASLRAEPLGQNVLQYLSRGKLVIVADRGGPLEWVHNDKNGLHFETGNVQSLTTQLVRFVTEQDLREKTIDAVWNMDTLHSDQEIAASHLEAFSAIGRA